MNKLQRTGSNVAEIVIVVLILAVVNFLGYKFFHRFDMTPTKQYSVSKVTKDTLAALTDPVNVEFFCSQELPPNMQLIRDEVKNKLYEYQMYSKGRFKLKVTDPKDDEKEKERAQNLGVPELQVNVVKKDAMSVAKAFFGIALSYEDKSEAIPAIQDTGSLEYEITTRLIKLTTAEKPKIGVFSGAFTTSEQQRPPSYQGLNQLLSGETGLYEIVELDPQRDQQLPDGLKGVIIAGAWGMSDSLKYSLDQFLMKGGQVIIAVDPMMQPGQQMGGGQQAYPSLPTIEDQLEKYGVKLNKKLVADPPPACAQAPIPTQFGFYLQVQYPLWPNIGPDGMNKLVPAVAPLESLVMPWCCPLEKVDVPGVTYETVAQTSPASFLINSPFNLDPQQDWIFLATSSETKGPFTVVALVSGKIPSAFPEGPPAPKPPPPAAPGEEKPVTTQPQFDASQRVDQSDGKGRLMVLTSAIALSDNGLKQFQGNGLFLANIVDMLLLGNDLINIRSAPVTSRPLNPELTEAQKSFFRWMNVLAVPVLLALFGLALWALKNRRRAAIQHYYSEK